jgi:transposase
MSVYLEVDFHARPQTVCWCDTADGIAHQRTLDQQQDDMRDFYTQFAVPAVVGLEASGYARWFHRLLESLGHRLPVGDAYVIRKCALRRQKNVEEKSRTAPLKPKGAAPKIVSALHVFATRQLEFKRR